MIRLDFSHERDLTIDILITRIKGYFSDADFDLVKKAYDFACKAHQGQKRSSGEDYIIHPLNVAALLVKLHMDIYSIIAGLLHDVIEDCEISEEEIGREFGKDVQGIVVGLTKISKIQFKSKEESQAENFRKMVVAMAKDIRVIIVKLADRMHNMRTLQYVSAQKQHAVAKETQDIYVPLANRLGINSVKAELEDLCLRYLKPEIYYKLAEQVAMKRSERDDYIQKTAEIIIDRLKDYDVIAEVKGRSKHFFSIYKKMLARGVDFDQIQDILAFRILVNNITECYKVLGIVHSSFTPIPGRFKDYIAIPKVNNYQSLHTTVIGPLAERIEVQIRTYEMDQVAETGVAAHWKYKEGIVGKDTKLDWVMELLQFNQEVSNNNDFLDVVRNDINAGGIFVFTPKGDVHELKKGATPLDFAYAVHTEVGNHCLGAKVNGKMVPLKHRMKSGDTCEILTSKTQNPSKDWLNIAKTSRAKTKIKQWLLKIEREKNKELGIEILEKVLKLYGTNLKKLQKSSELENIMTIFKQRSEDDLYVNVGVGKILPSSIIENLPGLEKEEDEEKKEVVKSYSQTLTTAVRKKSSSDNAVIVDGMDDVLVRIARCCNPIPGDPIVGYITRGRGITIHTSSCKRLVPDEINRSVPVEWNSDFSFKHPVNIRVIAHDRPGVLSLLSKNINALGINIRSALAKSLPDTKGSFIFEVEVKDYSELLKTISTLESLEEVLTVGRV